MGSFTHFYTTMLGFVMYRLYQSLNLHYPPKIALLSALNHEVETQDQESNVKYCTLPSKMSEVIFFEYHCNVQGDIYGQWFRFCLPYYSIACFVLNAL